MDTPSPKRNMARTLIAAVRLRFAPTVEKPVEMNPQTAALHRQLESLDQRLGNSLDALRRRLSHAPTLVPVPVRSRR